MQQGDNKIFFYAYAKDGTKAEVSTTLTYYTNLDFTSTLSASSETLYVNESKDVTFTVGIKTGTNATVSLYNTDVSGALKTAAGVMKDDGVLPDEIQTDGVYTVKLPLNPTQTGNICYKVQVSKTGQNTYTSENKCLSVTTHFTNAEISKSVQLADSVESAFSGATSQAQKLAASKAAVNLLKSDPAIGTVSSTQEGGVWWITGSGILGFYEPFIAGQKAGEGGRRTSAVVSATPIDQPKFEVTYYPSEYLSNSSRYASSFMNIKAATSILATGVVKNEIKSVKSIIISPYINNPGTTSNFGNTDDYYGPWKTLKDKKACILQPTKEVLNNGNVNVSLDTFKNLGNYGYIHFSTHGDNFYNGLLNLWKDEWGPNSFLKGSLSQVVMLTGVYLPKKADGTFSVTGYEDDIKEKRIAISASGAVAILPSFIKYYAGSLPNSLVALSSCRSMYNNSMANAFLSKGAGAVFGFSDYVSSSYAQNTSNTIINQLIAGKTIKDAVDQAIASYGSNDGDSDPAYLMRAGSDDLVAGGSLKNGGFEDGVLTPWAKTGDGRIITQLGSTSPTEGSYMGIISTGLGYTTESGELSQDFCAAPASKQLSFNWNFFSEEFKEYCSSIYQDTFKVSICVEDDSTGSETCNIVLNKTVDSLCASVAKSDVSFDKGDVYNTGWLNQQIDFTAYAGKHIKLKFYATDVGDSIYDTAILIDKITISE